MTEKKWALSNARKKNWGYSREGFKLSFVTSGENAPQYFVNEKNYNKNLKPIKAKIIYK